MKTDVQMTDEIRDVNLSYLILAQALLRADRHQAIYQLGISEAMADLIFALTPMQIVKVAAGNMLMCRMRFDDELVWKLLTESANRFGEDESNARRLHASILMSGQFDHSVLP
jgi:flagellar transcriptional activator FlhD